MSIDSSGTVVVGTPNYSEVNYHSSAVYIRDISNSWIGLLTPDRTLMKPIEYRVERIITGNRIILHYY